MLNKQINLTSLSSSTSKISNPVFEFLFRSRSQLSSPLPLSFTLLNHRPQSSMEVSKDQMSMLLENNLFESAQMLVYIIIFFPFYCMIHIIEVNSSCFELTTSLKVVSVSKVRNSFLFFVLIYFIILVKNVFSYRDVFLYLHLRRIRNQIHILRPNTWYNFNFSFILLIFKNCHCF